LSDVKTASVLIDNGYLVKVLENEYSNARIDYLTFCDNICADASAARTMSILYDAAPVQTRDMSSRDRKKYANRLRFFSDLDKLPRFDVKLGKLVPFFERSSGEMRMRQKGVDVQIGVDMVAMSWDPAIKVDVIILIAGDADFEPAVNYVRGRGVRVILYHSGVRNRDGTRKIADSLRGAADETRLLTPEPIERSRYSGRKTPANPEPPPTGHFTEPEW